MSQIVDDCIARSLQQPSGAVKDVQSDLLDIINNTSFEDWLLFLCATNRQEKENEPTR